MPRGNFLVISAIIYGVFGLGLLVAPKPFMAVYGVTLDESGALMARVLGSALLAYSGVFWLVRNALNSEILDALLLASFA